MADQETVQQETETGAEMTGTETSTTEQTTSTGADGTTTETSTETTTTETKEGGDETTALGKKEGEGEEGKPELPPILGAPEGDYDLKAPEGRDFDKEAFDAVAPALKDMNLSNEGAQKVVDAYAEKVLPIIEQRITDKIGEQQQIATAEFKKTWLDEAKKDPEIGGAKWDESLHIAASVFDKVGLKEADPFRKLLEESGLGNHPDQIRFMRRVGQLLGEDKFERGEGDANLDNRAPWDKVYGAPTEAATT